MPGPIVHTAAMQQCSKLLAQSGIKVRPGWWIANMMADKDLPSHGYSFESGTGTILDQIKAISGILKPLRLISPVYFEHACRLICHLCVDSFSIGQISRDRWGKVDNRIDFFSEFVCGKKLYGITTTLHAYSHIKMMKQVYRDYIEDSRCWDFLFSHSLVLMTRRCVQFGAEYAYYWIMKGLE